MQAGVEPRWKPVRLVRTGFLLVAWSGFVESLEGVSLQKC